MLRLLIVGLIVFMVIMLLRRILGANRPAQADAARLETSAMVKCSYCDLHVPESEAIESEGQYFCSAEHRTLENQDA